MPFVVLFLAVTLQGYQPAMSRVTGFPTYCSTHQQMADIGRPGAGGAAYRGTIRLSPETCRGFKIPGIRRVDSLISLGHERAHLLAVRNEFEASCRGLLRVKSNARKLHMRMKQVWIDRYIKRSPLERCSQW